MTVRQHIVSNLKRLSLVNSYFRTSDIQELSYEGKEEFGRFLGSPETYTREFRRMRTDGVIEVEKDKRKMVSMQGRKQTIWRLITINEKTLAGNNPKVVEAIISGKFHEKFDNIDNVLNVDDISF